MFAIDHLLQTNPNLCKDTHWAFFILLFCASSSLLSILMPVTPENGFSTPS